MASSYLLLVLVRSIHIYQNGAKYLWHLMIVFFFLFRLVVWIFVGRVFITKDRQGFLQCQNYILLPFKKNPTNHCAVENGITVLQCNANKQKTIKLVISNVVFPFYAKNIFGMFNVSADVVRYCVENVKTSSSHHQKIQWVCCWLNLSSNKNPNDVESRTCWTSQKWWDFFLHSIDTLTTWWKRKRREKSASTIKTMQNQELWHLHTKMQFKKYIDCRIHCDLILYCVKAIRYFYFTIVRWTFFLCMILINVISWLDCIAPISNNYPCGQTMHFNVHTIHATAFWCTLHIPKPLNTSSPYRFGIMKGPFKEWVKYAWICFALL